jgi:hypothetical protein
MKFQIEKGVPVPEATDRKTKYPFAKMAVGDSFSFPVSDRHKITNAACAWARYTGNGAKFRTLTSGDVSRVWRVK